VDETLDRLSGDWWIYQLRRGHRYATDDVLTAWTAIRAGPGSTRVLDLGAGVGSIGLMVLRLLPPGARLTSIEALEASVALARRTAAYNGVSGRVDVRLGDLRDPAAVGGGERFDLITANPPYLPPGTGWASPDPQRRAARFELRGDVGDYCLAAARHLAPGGRFCFCHAAGDPRPEPAALAAGLAVRARRLVTFREGRPPGLALHVCSWPGAGAPAREELPPLRVRDAQGRRTAEYLDVLRALGIVE
jgi:tRNA1(Val) A37 N6-methylase TrmN6